MDATSGFMALFLGAGEEGAGAGGVRASATGSDSAAQSSQAEIDARRSIVLGFALQSLGWLEAQPNAVPSQDCGGLATEELPLVLAVEITTEGRPTGSGSRGHEVDPEHVEGESDVGSAKT